MSAGAALAWASRGVVQVGGRFGWGKIFTGLVLGGGVIMAYNKGVEAWENFEEWKEQAEADVTGAFGSMGLLVGVALLAIIVVMSRRRRGPSKVVNIAT